MQNETEKIQDRYEKRKNSEVILRNNTNLYFNHYSQCERELKYKAIFFEKFTDISDKRIIEIGAGTGINIYFFQKTGFDNKHIYANELLPDRFEILKKNFTNINLIEGDAANIDANLRETFDIVFQSTVFTSILDSSFRQVLADRMWNLLKPGGFILWYDFVYDNPKNKDVVGIKKAEIRQLFPQSKKIKFYRTTLAPPIGRRVKKMYHLFNLFPFLRTHVIAVIEK